MADADPKIIPFGKYKGRLLDEVLADDPGYLQWLCGQDWFRAKFNILHQVIINRGAEPEETPEHNALQVKFLNEDFRERFLQYLTGLSRCPESDVEFEVGGVDVVLSTSIEYQELSGFVRGLFHYFIVTGNGDEHYVTENFERYKHGVFGELRIELKPVV